MRNTIWMCLFMGTLLGSPAHAAGQGRAGANPVAHADGQLVPRNNLSPASGWLIDEQGTAYRGKDVFDYIQSSPECTRESEAYRSHGERYRRRAGTGTALGVTGAVTQVPVFLLASSVAFVTAFRPSLAMVRASKDMLHCYNQSVAQQSPQ